MVWSVIYYILKVDTYTNYRTYNDSEKYLRSLERRRHIGGCQ